MTLQEFVDRTDYEPDYDEWLEILKYYQKCDGDTDEFCRVYNFGRFARQLPREMLRELRLALGMRATKLNDENKDYSLIQKMFSAI